jgi:ABC-type amino acid transport substrate-binding protein
MPIYKCSNGKWRIGNGGCVYSTEAKATEVWQAILASGAYAAEKVSYDYDDVLSTDKGKEQAETDVKAGKVVYIISARQSVEGMLSTASRLGIPKGRVYATGSNKAKVEKVKSLGIKVHKDNNPDVIKELNGIGKIFHT